MKKLLSDVLDIEHPILVAPMFLISNVEMVVSALENGATAAFPALNYRNDSDLRNAIIEIRGRTDKPFGVNLIVNKSNPKYKQQLNILLELKVDYIITSLGNPKETIDLCKPLGIKVFCDVTNLKYARKVEGMGADALIAVDSSAGGHCGDLSKELLLEELTRNCSIPTISAGGVACFQDVEKCLALGACGVSVGTIFLAAKEANLSTEYQNALIGYGAKDIVLSTKMSGSPLTVINTPYVKKLGTKPSFLEKLMISNKWFKKWMKFIIAFRGMKQIEKAAFGATYKTVWCAGPAIESIKSIRPLSHILLDLVYEK